MAGAPKNNRNAANAKIWSDAVKKHILSGKKLDGLAKKLVDMALDGDLGALREVGDRLEGKPAQSTIISGDADNPLIIETDRPKLTAQEWLKLHGLATAGGASE